MVIITNTDQSDDNDNSKVVITGGDDLHIADVIIEDNEKKLLVKSTSVPEPLGNLFFEYAENGGSNDLNVNGSVTPVDFMVTTHATLDKVITSLVFEAFDGGIKINNFLGMNSELTNGIIIEVKSEDQIFQFQPITNTQEFDSLFSTGSGRSFEVIFASGLDSMVARFGIGVPFILKPQGTYGSDDYIKVMINDNVSTISRLRFLAVGQLD